ncbi:MAG TPA: type VI secretion system protein TssA [Polyangiaceae bacterium]|nr:type VI secretion system protein TssA [Polyangiaceae bacterium]
MAGLDAGKLLAPIAGDSPSGPNLESDADFLALETAATTKAEKLVGGGGADEGPDWNNVSSRAASLLERTKDVRVLCHFTIAELHRGGAQGFARGLHLTRELLEANWATIHPELDPDDDPSLPLARVMALAALTVPPMLVALRRSPLLVSRALGPLSLNDIAPTQGAPDATRVHAIFQETPLPELEACATALKGGLDDLQGIDKVFQTHVPDRGPDQNGLVQFFKQAYEAVRTRFEERRAAEQPAVAAEGQAEAAAPRTRGLSGDILSREDVVRALDKISVYFEKNEPSSPIPLLVERCKRLVTMTFLEIVNDLAPDGLKQAHLVVGKKDGK